MRAAWLLPVVSSCRPARQRASRSTSTPKPGKGLRSFKLAVPARSAPASLKAGKWLTIIDATKKRPGTHRRLFV